MAISPPSDIVLDVARAVEPSGLEAARTALARRVGATAPTGADAAFSLGAAGPGNMRATRGAIAPDGADALKKFESVVLGTFIQTMLPKDAGEVYGKGLAGDMWKSMMAGRIADVMTERGGIGIASRLLADHYVEGKSAVPVGPVSHGTERTEADRQAALSDALVQDLQRRVARAMEEPRGANTDGKA
ncbi:rod-binding protein [Mesorhizobium sp. LHD-90]|uniref:rod-binding protein n=1 Tax=Mesorhizobium sp. LHD-90 TaxID=3071414 RepID=UPI0027E0E676|nr:rod-binding protein [Mesorhizobium sp. LHD-90]MDQ6433707.1 rod-binding protein [Mesorhizobium sp. LHD-90]